MKRMCVALLCIALLVVRHTASAQENGPAKSDELARSSLYCNRRNSTLDQPVAQAPRVCDQSEPATRGNDLRAAHDPEPPERAEVSPTDSPDSTGATQLREKEAAAILEVGAEPARSLSGGGWTLSPTVAVEVTPIENWLELEFGVTPTFSDHSTEWDTDVCSKNPGPSPRE